MALAALLFVRPDWLPLAPNDGVVRELALLFALGSLACVWRAAIPLSLADLGLVIALIAWNPGGLGRNGLFAPLLTYAVLVLAYHPHLQWPGFRRLGDYSYGVYVYSFPLQQTLMPRSPELEPTGLFLLSLPLAIGVACISWHALEQPALRLKSRFNHGTEPP
ncbi:MAG: hypothetical protein ABIO63_10275 [Casimicrobiaceae bacterium]